MNKILFITVIATAVAILVKNSYIEKEENTPVIKTNDFGIQKCPQCGSIMRRELKVVGYSESSFNEKYEIRYYCPKKNILNWKCPLFVYFRQVRGRWIKDVMWDTA